MSYSKYNILPKKYYSNIFWILLILIGCIASILTFEFIIVLKSLIK